MAKMDKKWAILCSTAVAAVYASGYFATAGQEAAIQQSSPSVAVSSVPANNPSHSNTSSIGSDTSQSDNSSTQAGTSQQASTPQTSQYKDGTYRGLGMNRRGSIGITLTINKGKISRVVISDFEMHYSESDVVGLPDEVLKNQSADVDNVTGATYSTQAFSDAVQDALLKAENS